MKPIQRLGGMAGLLVLVSLFSPIKASASETIASEKEVNTSVNDRIAAIHHKLEEAEKNVSGEQAEKEVSNLIAQWGDWYDWGDWNDWSNWGDWLDSWTDWGDWINY